MVIDHRFRSRQHHLRKPTRGVAGNNGLRNRIKASGVERVATEKPFHGHYTTPGGTIAANGLAGIFRTSRMKTAGWR
jgi:hypothetical protein